MIQTIAGFVAALVVLVAIVVIVANQPDPPEGPTRWQP